MDPISVDANTGGPNKVGTASRLQIQPTQKVQIQPSETRTLTDIGKLAERVDSSSVSIRPEAVERGKALLSDPNWPNDSTLEGLAEKLIDNEDFDT
jgi:hypothetical protein